MNSNHVSDDCIHCVQLPNYTVTSCCIKYFALVIKLLEQLNGYLFRILVYFMTFKTLWSDCMHRVLWLQAMALHQIYLNLNRVSIGLVTCWWRFLELFLKQHYVCILLLINGLHWTKLEFLQRNFLFPLKEWSCYNNGS